MQGVGDAKHGNLEYWFRKVGPDLIRAATFAQLPNMEGGGLFGDLTHLSFGGVLLVIPT